MVPNAVNFSLETIEKIEPALSFLYKHWWQVDLTGLENLPKAGPALIVGNSGSVLPWTGLMLLFALMSYKPNPRRLNIMADLDWVPDERLYSVLTEIGFVPWSADNAKKLFENNELVVIFPEGIDGLTKPFSEKYRLCDFDWTQLLPAVERQVPIYPLATLGCEDSIPVYENLKGLANFLNLPEYPVTPFFPWLPFPLNMLSFAGTWRMRLLKCTHFVSDNTRDDIEETAKKHSRHLEGEIQSELNRLLRKYQPNPLNSIF